MDIKKRDFLSAAGAATLASGALAQGARRPNQQPSTVDPHYKPRRINKAIELWEDGQPIYYNSAGMGPGVDLTSRAEDGAHMDGRHQCRDGA